VRGFWLLMVVVLVTIGIGVAIESASAPSGGPVAPAPVGETAEVTGFTSTPLDNPSSGPISVQLDTTRANEVAAVLDALPLGPQPSCMEDALLYRIVFRPSPGARPNYEADGYACVAAVLVKITGRSSTPRRDANCALIDAVRRLLPRKAVGTQRAVVGCNAVLKGSPGSVSGRLVRVGGPSPGAAVGVVGRVVLAAEKNGREDWMTTSSDGRFAVAVPAGIYRVAGYSPDVRSEGKELRCTAAAPVTVQAGLPAEGVEVVCNIS